MKTMIRQTAAILAGSIALLITGCGPDYDGDGPANGGDDVETGQEAPAVGPGEADTGPVATGQAETSAIGDGMTGTSNTGDPAGENRQDTGATDAGSR